MIIGYQYDAYGAPSVKSYQTEKANLLARVNPLLYRGYVYDLGANLYYLQTRYYDAALGRFINADDPANLGADGSQLSYNLFSYCLNNPVNRTDAAGTWSGWATAGVVVGAAVGANIGANSWYNARALEFTNPGSNEVVLGRSGTYEQVAQSRGSTYFHTSNTRWDEVYNMFGVGKNGMWKINKAFLDQQIAAGRTFVLSNNPIIDRGYYLAKEVAYLVSKGIGYSIL